MSDGPLFFSVVEKGRVNSVFPSLCPCLSNEICCPMCEQCSKNTFDDEIAGKGERDVVDR